MEIIIGIAIFLFLIVLVIGASLMGNEPSLEPPQRAMKNRSARNKLFRSANWEKGVQQIGVPVQADYNRPLEVAPDNQLLPPPRDIEGVNGE